jgi:hypothetical protein
MIPRASLLGIALAFQLVAQTSTPLTAVRIASGFANPTYVTSPPGDFDRLFVTEQFTGRIQIVERGVVLTTPFLSVSGKNSSSGNERGLLGLAFHPRYAQNGRFFVYYTRLSDGASIIERYNVSANDPNVADPASGVLVIPPISQPFSNHNGGCLQFGRDGYLYVGLGDGGSAGDPSCNAQNGQSLLGKILRLDVDSANPVPPTNPFVGNPAFRAEIWALGLRNPWRFSFDRQNGDMFVGDVGQDTREEVSFQPGSSTGGENYGWKIMEGENCFSTAACQPGFPPCRDPRLVMPIHTYPTGSDCTVVGGYVYRGCAIPDLIGTYFFADYCSARIWSFRYDGANKTAFVERTTELRPAVSPFITSITSFGENARGELLIVSRPGNIFQVVARGTPPSRDLGFGKVGGNGKQPVFETCGLLTQGYSAQFILRDAPASVSAVLAISTTQNPITFPGLGTLVPNPVLIDAPFVTDPSGTVTFSIQGGLFSAVLYGQWLMFDPGASGGVGVSNALEITFP